MMRCILQSISNMVHAAGQAAWRLLSAVFERGAVLAVLAACLSCLVLVGLAWFLVFSGLSGPAALIYGSF